MSNRQKLTTSLKGFEITITLVNTTYPYGSVSVEKSFEFALEGELDE